MWGLRRETIRDTEKTAVQVNDEAFADMNMLGIPSAILEEYGHA